MDQIVEKGLLYDYYGKLLTKRQQQIYEDAVSNDLSLSELADAYEISRQGVHDLLRRCDRTLAEYEDTLGCIKRDREIIQLADRLKSDADALTPSEIGRIADEIKRCMKEES
ncbi:MAG: DNA-binding protein [Lachnospiraceae bacterium]|nr:DNA-binding protein [Lachnospiraceae bacterium]